MVRDNEDDIEDDDINLEALGVDDDFGLDAFEVEVTGITHANLRKELDRV